MNEQYYEEKIDEIVSDIGIGKFQAINYIFICFIGVISTLSSQAFIFTSRDIQYRCLVPECEESSSSFDQPWLKAAIPLQNSVLSKCERYSVQSTSHFNLTEYDSDNPGSCNRNIFNNETITCEHWIYKQGYDTIVKDFNFPCENWKISLIGTVCFAGQVVSLLFTGFLSDKYGRVRIMVVLAMTMELTGLIQSFSPNYWIYLVFEFLSQLSNTGLYISSFNLGVEILSAKSRIYGVVLLSLCSSVGYVFLGLLAWIIESWRILLISLYTPIFLAILAYFLIPESFRWLHAKGNRQECINVLKKAAFMNGVKISENRFLEIQETDSLIINSNKVSSKNVEYEILSSLRAIIKSSKLLIRYFLCSLSWFGHGILFYGIQMNSVNISNNEEDVIVNYLSVTSVSCIGILMAFVFMRFMENKYSVFICLLSCGFSCILFYYLPNSASTAKFILYHVSQVSVRISFSCIYLYTSEIFPTELRTSAVSLSGLFGKLGAMLVPQIIQLKYTYPSLPVIIFGFISIITAFVVLKQPKTKGKALPNTVQEAELLS